MAYDPMLLQNAPGLAITMKESSYMGVNLSFFLTTHKDVMFMSSHNKIRRVYADMKFHKYKIPRHFKITLDIYVKKI